MTLRDKLHNSLDEYIDSLNHHNFDDHNDSSEMDLLIKYKKSDLEQELQNTNKVQFKNLITIHF